MSPNAGIDPTAFDSGSRAHTKNSGGVPLVSRDNNNDDADHAAQTGTGSGETDSLSDVVADAGHMNIAVSAFLTPLPLSVRAAADGGNSHGRQDGPGVVACARDGDQAWNLTSPPTLTV